MVFEKGSEFDGLVGSKFVSKIFFVTRVSPKYLRVKPDGCFSSTFEDKIRKLKPNQNPSHARKSPSEPPSHSLSDRLLSFIMTASVTKYCMSSSFGLMESGNFCQSCVLEAHYGRPNMP